MKTKFLSIMLAIVMLIASISVCASAENKNYSLGDINGDGKITASDARIVLRVSAKLEEKTEIITKYGDVNSDGKVSASDARKILRISAKLEKLPCENGAHEYISEVIAPTCSSEGYTTNKCKLCNMTDGSRTNVIKAIGHSYKVTETSELSCTTDGYKLLRCEHCGVIKQEDYTKATGHDFNDWKTENGIRTRACKKCNLIETEDHSVASKITYTHTASNGEKHTSTYTIVAPVGVTLLTSKGQAIVDKYNLYKNKPEWYSYYCVSYNSVDFCCARWYEGKDAIGTKIVIYGIGEFYDENTVGLSTGYDLDGYMYKADGTLEPPCPTCSLPKGKGNNQCSDILHWIKFDF